MATALATSMQLPPPIASSASQPLSTNVSNAAWTSKSLGLGVRSCQSRHRTLTSARCGAARSTQPAASTPGSLTTIGHRPPTRRTAPPTSASVPSPNTTSGITNLLTRLRNGTPSATAGGVEASCSNPSLLLPGCNAILARGGCKSREFLTVRGKSPGQAPGPSTAETSVGAHAEGHQGGHRDERQAGQQVGPDAGDELGRGLTDLVPGDRHHERHDAE